MPALAPMDPDAVRIPRQGLIALWPDVAALFGIGARDAIYRAAAKGQLPFEVLRIGGHGRYMVRVVDLRRVLGLPVDEPAGIAS